MTTADQQAITKRALFQLLVMNYPAQLSEGDLIAQIARDPADATDAVAVLDALRDLQADRLVRRHGRFCAASRTGVAAVELIEP